MSEQHEETKGHLDDAAEELRKTMEQTRRVLESRLPEIQPGRRIVVSRFPGWMHVDVIAIVAGVLAAATAVFALYIAYQVRANTRGRAEAAYQLCLQTNAERRDANAHVRAPLRDLLGTAADVLRKSAATATDGARTSLYAAADRLDADARKVP